ncbi:6-hydroxymethylpterin diphosphokinase MptE-like protein [Metabacillus sp. YM-086]|uniref:6-hydroxymethylpterin diphosphokinase MptE-like protein n=1 Tax=Metabacillus sp. YM-086 TaxID=3341729 RepID=UPI001B9FDC7B
MGKIKLLYNFVYKTNKYIKELVFPFSKRGRQIKKYKDIHLNKRCFIIGNGPSLTSGDLDKLSNEITFAFNRVYYIFNRTTWRPTYYCSEDNKTIFRSKEEINSIKVEHKFFPVNFPWDYKIHFTNANYYLFKFGNKNIEPQFSRDIVKGIYWGNTVAYTAIQIAVYMGVKEIYLLGVDHNFSKMLNDKGEIIIDKTAKDYFTEEYNTDKDDLYIPNVEVSTRAFKVAKKYADKNNIKIYNATRGGKLEVFERVDFDKLFLENERVTI